MLILVLGERYSNCYSSLELASKYNLWQVGSVIVFLKVYQKYKICPALLYMQHMHMECNESHICHDIFLDQNVNDNAYSTPLIHENLDVDHKMLILGIGLYHNKCLHLLHHYPDYDTICLSFFFYWLFFCIFPDQWLNFYDDPYIDVVGIIYPDWHHCFVWNNAL